MFKISKIIIAIIMFSILVAFRYYLDKPYVKIINPEVESIYNHSVNMAAVIFGETRKTMAAVLWGRVLYYHTETSHGTFYGPRKDVKPSDNVFKDEGEQILPILRLITWLDNHFIKAYDFGGYFLAVTLNKPQEGIGFLEEGIRNNPASYDLYQGLAFIYFSKVKNYNMAINYARKALDNLIKYPDKEKNQDLDCINSLRIIGHSYRILGDKDNAEKYFYLIGEVGPEFIPLRERLINDLKNEVYIRINKNTLGHMKGKISDDKMENLRKMSDRDYSQDMLSDRLKTTGFTKEEIKEVLKYVQK